MRIFPNGIFLFLAITSFACGVREVGHLRTMLVAESEYERGEGSVLRVERSVVSGGGDGPNYFVYQVFYRYRVGEHGYAGDVLSPACDLCVASNVKAMTGKLPKDLAAGDPVTVYTLRGNPQLAYLALTTPAELRSQYWVLFMLLLVAPAWFYAFSRIDWQKDDQDSG
jgi:hypothetical protein